MTRYTTLFFLVAFTLFQVKCGKEKAKSNKQKPTITIIKESNSFQKRSCSFENNTIVLGQGLIKPLDTVVNFQLDFYNDSSCLDQLSTFSFNSSSKEPEFCAKFHSLEYGVFRFVCTDIHSNSYEVIVNYDEKMYLKKSNKIEFVSWNEYINQSMAVRPKQKIVDNEIFSLPDLSSSKIKLPNEEYISFCVKEVKGDWVRVQYNCLITTTDLYLCNDVLDKCDEKLMGWIKWKQNEQLLIDIPTNT